MLTEGKDVSRKNGYAATAVKNQLYRWIWEKEGGHTTAVTHDHANGWVEELAYSSTSGTHRNHRSKALRMPFEWRHHHSGEERWYPRRMFETGSRNPQDVLTRDERRRIREASLEYGTIPAYNDLSPEERDRWKARVAQRLGKLKDEIGPDDWDRVNGFEVPSSVAVSLDTGLRPIEVERAKVSWVDPSNGAL